MSRFLIAIPAYNESSGIAAVISDAIKFSRDCRYFCNIVVFDDGSNDKTTEIVRSFGWIEYISEKNQGLGIVIERISKYAIELDFDFTIILEGDGQYKLPDTRKIEEFLIANTDCVIFQRKNYEFLRIKKYRKILHRIQQRVYRDLSNLEDPTTGLRLVSRRFFEELTISNPYNPSYDFNRTAASYFAETTCLSSASARTVQRASRLFNLRNPLFIFNELSSFIQMSYYIYFSRGMASWLFMRFVSRVVHKALTPLVVFAALLAIFLVLLSAIERREIDPAQLFALNLFFNIFAITSTFFVSYSVFYPETQNNIEDDSKRNAGAMMIFCIITLLLILLLASVPAWRQFQDKWHIGIIANAIGLFGFSGGLFRTIPKKKFFDSTKRIVKFKQMES